MCFAFGFQQNHGGELRKLAALVIAARANGIRPFVDLDLLQAAIKMSKILAPAQLKDLMEMAGREISGRFELTDVCEECHGRGEYEKYFQTDPEDMDTVYDDLVSCSTCGGAGHRLSIEAKNHFGLLDKKARVEALDRCHLSYFEAQRTLRRFRAKTLRAYAHRHLGRSGLHA